jgi:hypothetical protein
MVADENNPFIQHIRRAVSEGDQARLVEEQLRDSRAQQLAEQHAAEMLERLTVTIAGMPACIECHFSEGRSYGRIMRLRYDESEEDPRWQAEYWDGHKPNPNKLLEAAMQVFVYCHQHNLKPYLVRDYDFDVQKYFLHIGIDCGHHVP